MTSWGETGTILGIASALSLDDVVFCQYREMGVLYHRGFSVKNITDNCTGNVHDNVKGRQMPIHFTAKNIGIMSISSPLATQICQAAGYGYGLSMNTSNDIAVVFFGDGAASEGDFYAGINFAQTLGGNTLFVCRNNQYAISTPISENTSGDHLASKAMSFGMKTIRVDGNDALAVYKATQYAKKYIQENNMPVFLECMSYRISDHSTSDHSILYREQSEIDHYKEEFNPILRLGK
jgi:2-oxoisovalerate dehydrogenase E1 component alpha subunit